MTPPDSRVCLPGVSVLHRLLVTALACTLALPAWASSLAILPLDKGPSAPDYDGLGYVLSGMLTTDLSHVQAIQLVERQRLDDVLSEVELGTSTFIDPATAAKMGKGLGAEWVLVGAWTVVKDDLALNARVIVVESGDILVAADAQGPVTDYVTVEKDLIEALLAELPLTVSSGERRKLIAEAPTEDFQALRQYSDGVAASRKGELEAAQKAFQAALAADPAYADARAAIDGLRASIEAESARRKDLEETEEQRLERQVLEGTVDERTRPSNFKHTSYSQGELALRLNVLWTQERYCQRYEELWAYAEHMNWRFDTAPPPKGKRKELSELGFRVDGTQHMIERGMKLGYIIDERGMWSNDRSNLYGIMGGLTRADRFVFDHAINRMLMGSIERCLSPEGALEKLREVRANLDGTPAMSMVMDNESPNVTLKEFFLAQEVEAEIWVTGSLSAARVAELEALRDSFEDTDRRMIDHWMKRLADHAETTAKIKPARTSTSVEELERRAQGLIARDPAVLDTSNEVCAAWANPEAKYGGPKGLENDWKNYKRSANDLDRWRRRWAIVSLDLDLLPATLMGCVKGVPGPLSSADAVREWHREQAARVAPGASENPHCEGAMSGVNAWLNEFQWQGDQWLTSTPHAIRSVVTTWTTGCLIPPDNL